MDQDRQIRFAIPPFFIIAPLHDSVLFKCIDCATSLLQSLSHQLLAASLFERFRESLRGRFHRDHANSVDIAKQEITGAHTSRSDFDWDAKVDYLMSGRGILRVRTPTEGGKVHVLGPASEHTSERQEAGALKDLNQAFFSDASDSQ